MSLFDKWRQECRDREAEGYDERPYYTFLEEHIAELEAELIKAEKKYEQASSECIAALQLKNAAEAEFTNDINRLNEELKHQYAENQRLREALDD